MRTLAPILLALGLGVSGCRPARTGGAAPETGADRGSRAEQRLRAGESGPQVAAAIARGDYAAAVAITERTDLPPPELDHARGQSIL